MKYLLDTCACSDMMAGRSSVIRRARKLPASAELWTSVVVEGELLFGVRRAPIERRNALDRAVRSFLESLAGSIAVTREAAEQYGIVKARLAAQGTPIPSNDVWIAATAMTEGMLLVSGDEHFSRIDGFEFEDWSR